MRFLWIAFLFCHASFSNDAACKKSLALISNVPTEEITTLYDFKNNNHGNWVVAEKRFDVDFVLAPQKVQPYGLRWKVKQDGKANPIFQDGALDCDIPLTWQLRPQKTLHIMYPPAANKHEEDTPLYSLTTFAGFYLEKNKFHFPPDVAGLIWHLYETWPSEDALQKIVSSYSFLSPNNLSIQGQALDKDDNLQLVGLNFSDQQYLNQGNQRWFIADAGHHDSRKQNGKHKAWLPWLDTNRPEFSALTPVEMFNSSIVANLTLTSIFHRDTHSYDPNWGSVADIAQLYYDIVSPLVRGRMEGGKPLFAHLLLQAKVGYELFTFEILADGTIEPLTNEPIIDPSYIGLPSAQELDFASITPSDGATIE